MITFLNSIFGTEIQISEYIYSEKVPFYIRDGYKAQMLTWKANKCILISPNASAWRLPVLKKQLQNLQKLCDVPCALLLEKVTAMQRRSLIEDNVPFVALSQQVFLPFWGCFFWEKFKADIVYSEKMSPGTQAVFLYLYYLQKTETVNLTMLAKELHLSKATCTRAVCDLAAFGLIHQNVEGVNKWIRLAGERDEFLLKGYPRLKSPVERQIYVRNLPERGIYFKSGILALADITMVGAENEDGALAVFKKDISKIPKGDLISKQEFEDFGGYVVEAWSYDPALFVQDGHVDELSLLLSLQDHPDERIQQGLDVIREKFGLPVE